MLSTEGENSEGVDNKSKMHQQKENIIGPKRNTGL